MALFLAKPGISQFGPPILYQDFGMGDADPNTIGAPLPSGSTSFTFGNSLCPDPGSYTIMRRVNVKGCFGNEWIPLGSDYTSDNVFGKDFSNMMIVNVSNSPDSRIIYMDTVRKNICPGTPLNFSMGVINLDQPKDCSPIPAFPSFAMVVEDGAGNKIAADTLYNLGFASPTPSYKFSPFGFNFVLPPGVTTLVCKVVLLRTTADNNCGDDFAIDEIMLRPVGPNSQIKFGNNPTGEIVKSVCFQDNVTIPLTGSMDAYYPNPALQWQQSTDGTTWVDIPGATNATYAPTFSVADTFLFRLSGSDATTIGNINCRVVSNIITVQVDGIPSNFNTTSNSPICAGGDLKFNVDQGATYSWTGPNGFADNIQFPHIPNVRLADSGMYYVEVKTRGGCVGRDSTYATVIGTDIHAGPDTAICKGETVRLFATPGTGYSWTPAAGLSDASAMNPLASPDKTTIYKVSVTESSGCTGSATARVTIINSVAVKAIFSGTEVLCRSYDSASFKNASEGLKLNYNWSFGNGQVSALADPPLQTYTISDNTYGYTVRLIVADTLGCADTSFHTLKVADNCYIAVPTAFTPDGDGLNDYLYPLNAYKANNLNFTVYNRNGRVVFETKDWTRKWDGKLNGVEQASGVYVWILQYVDERKKQVFLKGTTVLIR